LIQNSANYDNVVYGYAFRDHWLWVNGLNNEGVYYGIILWKDYNCNTYTSLAHEGFVAGGIVYSSFDTATKASIESGISAKASTNSYNDIWNAAFDIPYVSPNTASTYIVSQDRTAKYYARVCIVNHHLNTNPVGNAGGPSGAWGSSLLLQMR
jgi:hypothetical protein